ncbi:MAG: glycosyltransferase family 2 protein [Solirubrobacteraceae bacterium]
MRPLSAPVQAHGTREQAPLCTVVISAYMAAATIGQALDSVLAQTLRDFEVVVVDDGSADATAEVVRGYLADPRVALHRQPNAGNAAARNLGIARTTGRFVAVLDSDDLWLPVYLESMVAALESAPDAGFAFTRAWVLERSPNRIRRAQYPTQVPTLPPDTAAQMLALLEFNYVYGSIMVRRELLEQLGGFDTSARTHEDYKLCLRILGAGHSAVHVPEPLGVYSYRTDSLSQDGELMLTDGREMFRTMLERGGLAPDATAVVRRRLAAIERELAACQRPSLRRRLRKAVGDATRPWRRRRRLRRVPPADIAEAFPWIG